MAKKAKTAKPKNKAKAAPKKAGAKKQTKREVEQVLRRGPIRRPSKPRAMEQTFPELPDIKDSVIQRHGKDYAMTMDNIADETVNASASKQAIRKRMTEIGATQATAYGYEFTRAVGEEHFTAKKIKRGKKAPDTDPVERETVAMDADLAAADAADRDATDGPEEGIE